MRALSWAPSARARMMLASTRARKRDGPVALWRANGADPTSQRDNRRMALVYSTDGGRMCPQCRRPQAACACAAQKTPPRGDGIVRVSRERAQRGGKTVTVVRGLGLDAAALAELGRRLRGACGSGGTAKEGTVEVQGDHVERVIAWLQAEGHTVRRAGG
jgi:translation initiation factor 1